MGRTAGFLLCLVLALAGCSTGPRIVVGSKNFTEQVLLGELIAQHLENRGGVQVERKLNLGGTLLAHKALESGAIDLYPEYTGTALTAVLRQPAAKDRNQVLERVRSGYSPLGLEWLDPLGFNNTFAMVVRSETRLRTLSEAAARREPWRLGVGYEFVQRPDGLDGLVQTYGLRLNGDPVSMDLGLLYPALRSGQIEMAAASATDGQLTDSFFTVLGDDREYFPPYECAIVIRSQTLREFPALKETLRELSGQITDAAMRRMNAAVDRDKRNAAEVARDFLGGLVLRGHKLGQASACAPVSTGAPRCGTKSPARAKGGLEARPPQDTTRPLRCIANSSLFLDPVVLFTSRANQRIHLSDFRDCRAICERFANRSLLLRARWSWAVLASSRERPNGHVHDGNAVDSETEPRKLPGRIWTLQHLLPRISRT